MTAETRRRQADKVIALTIFLGAFLFFQLELLFGKYLLPFFGGTSAVWITAMFTYQLILLAGYASAYHIAHLSPARGVKRFWILVGLVGIAVVAQTIFWGAPLLSPDCAMARADAGAPGLRVALTILAYTGMPMMLLATTSPLLQAWYSLQSDRPYRLYAVSNAGSMLGLLSYPLVMEVWLNLHQQQAVWFTLFAIFVAGFVYISRSIRHLPASQADTSREPLKPIGLPRYTFWICAAALGSALLLATTNRLTQDVASFPFIWMLPLCIYLLTFIFCFRDASRYRTQRYFYYLLFTILLVLHHLLDGTADHFLVQFFMLGLFLFIACTVCHGELYRTRPDPRQLTRYYLAIAFGGLLGSFLVAFIAPLVFDRYAEFTYGLAACWTLACVCYLQARRLDPPQPHTRVGLRAALLLSLPLSILVLFPKIGLLERLHMGQQALGVVLLALLALGSAALYVRIVHQNGHPRLRDLCVLGSLFILIVFAGVHTQITTEHQLAAGRNFYGTLRVDQFTAPAPDGKMLPYNVLVHGSIIHGIQYQVEPERHQPVAYYGPSSGLSPAITQHMKKQGERGLQVGIAGMGVGTLCAYFREQDYVDFYEINPLVIDWCTRTNYFTYIADAPSTLRTIEGDARIELEKQAAATNFTPYDILILDAFSSDAIPLHLLTLEALELYQRITRPDGLILFNISNKHLNLSPIIRSAAAHAGLDSVTILPNPECASPLDYPASWMIVGNDIAFAREAPFDAHTYHGSDALHPRPWTDAFSNVLKAMVYHYRYPLYR